MLLLLLSLLLCASLYCSLEMARVCVESVRACGIAWLEKMLENIWTKTSYAHKAHAKGAYVGRGEVY